jgi:hypothetical protein
MREGGTGREEEKKEETRREQWRGAIGEGTRREK